MNYKFPTKTLGFLSAALLGSLSNVSNAEDYALTISPLHLFFPVVEATLEKTLSENVSVAGILGYGSMTVESTTENIKFSVFEAGGQLRYYPGGTVNSGFQLGVEGMYIKPSLDDKYDVTLKTNGFAIGPFIGYKWNTESGAVYDLQVGYQFLFAQAKAKNSAGDEIDSSVSDGATLFNINAGFAF